MFSYEAIGVQSGFLDHRAIKTGRRKVCGCPMRQADRASLPERRIIMFTHLYFAINIHKIPAVIGEQGAASMIESSDGQARAPASGLDRLALVAANATIGSAFTSQVTLSGEAIALQQGERNLTYRQLNERVNRLASHMLKLGLIRGDRIALLSENRCEFVEVELAAAKLGVITACLNWRQADRELSHGINLVDPKLIVTSERYVPTLARLDCEVPHKLTLGEEYERALVRVNDAPEPPRLAEAEDGLVILYTSGTTGMPRRPW
jgi:non-ribosomal peptide synthetase component F